MATVLHDEKAPYSTAIKAILGLILLFLGVAAIFSWIGDNSASESFQLIAIIVVLIAFAFWSFFNMRFRITTAGVEASMIPFSYKVKYEEIDDVYVDKIPWWIGWGLRLWWRRIAFVSGHGSAVVIKKKTGIFKTFVLSAKDPEDFAKMIRDKMKARRVN